MTYSEIRKNEEVLAFIKKGNANLGAMGFTDHSEAHSGPGADPLSDCMTNLPAVPQIPSQRR